MIRFFRTVRKRLFENRRFVSYLGYALGEVILVVIGILLALQINSWQNERELRKKEKAYLSSIRQNLQEDLQNVRLVIEKNQIKDSLISESLRSLLNAKTDAEAMQAIIQNMPALADFSIFTQNRVAFDNMLSSENIDLISQENLRNHLSGYYSTQTLTYGTQDRAKELTRTFVDHITPLLMNRESINLVYEVESDFVSVDELDFRTSRMVFGDLFSMQRTLESHLLFLENYEKQIQGLSGSIDQFLDGEGDREVSDKTGV